MSNDVRAAGLILCRTINGVAHWLLLQNSKRLDWGFPKGHREAGETDIHTALRECAEESHIAVVEITGAALELSYVLATGKRQGRRKTVIYFPARTEQSTYVLSKEHSAAQWCSQADVLKMLPQKNIKTLFRQYLLHTQTDTHADKTV